MPGVHGAEVTLGAASRGDRTTFLILRFSAADLSAMTANQRTVSRLAAFAALAASPVSFAGPLTSVSLSGSVTFTDLIEVGNPDPVGAAGIQTTNKWLPLDLTLSDPQARVSALARFRSGDGPEGGQGPTLGDTWGLSMLSAIDLLEESTITGGAGHRLDLSFTDLTSGASTFILRGIVELSITGHVRVPDPALQKASTVIRAEAYAKSNAATVRLIDFGGVVLSDTGERVVNRSLWSTFEVVLSGAPGSASSVDMWIDFGFTTALSAIPSPAGALCLLAFGGMLAVSRRRNDSITPVR